ncbi:MAG: hypothetical protein HZA01_14645 [Nitrospinae bacterium]|nr:hypothetical protein [Nitrospinota bacterium]
MEEQPKTDEKEKKKKKSTSVERAKDIESSFNVLEECLNKLRKISGLPTIDKADYKKTAQSKTEKKAFKSKEEKTFWEHRQINHFRGDALRNAVATLGEEFTKRKEKAGKIAALLPLIDSIQANIQSIQKDLKNSISCRDRELSEAQEILAEKERKLQAQMALGVKGDLKDDETAKKMKALSHVRDEAIHSNILAIEAVEEAMETLGELKAMSGMAPMLLSYYKEYAFVLWMGGAVILGGSLLFVSASLVYEKISLAPSRSKKISPAKKEPAEGMGAEAPTKQIVVEEESPSLPVMPIPDVAREKELTPDESFNKILLKESPFIPTCENSYVVLADESLEQATFEKDVKHYLASKKFPVEGDRAIQVIKVRDDNEMIMAFENGAVNSPYCVNGKLFLPRDIGYDLGRFPVLLAAGMDPMSDNARLLIKEQIEAAKEKMGKNLVILLPKLYLGKTVEAKAGENQENQENQKNQEDQEYNEAVNEYWDRYLRIKSAAEGKIPGKVRSD